MRFNPLPPAPLYSTSPMLAAGNGRAGRRNADGAAGASAGAGDSAGTSAGHAARNPADNPARLAPRSLAGGQGPSGTFPGALRRRIPLRYEPCANPAGPDADSPFAARRPFVQPSPPARRQAVNQEDAFPDRVALAYRDFYDAGSVAVAEADPAAGVVIDLDETTHAYYALGKFAIEAKRDGAAQALGDLGQQSHASGHHPLAVVRADVVPPGATDFWMSIGSGITSIPFAALAIRGGAGEIREARALRRQLNAQQILARIQQRRLEQLHREATLPLSDQCPQLRLHAHAAAQRVADLGRFKRTNAWNSGIGYSSLGSGVTIAAKTATETALSTALALGANGTSQLPAWVAQTPWAAAAASGAGVVSCALAPVASGFALALGSCFVHSARIEGRRLGRGSKALEAWFKQPEIARCLDNDPAAAAYHRFIKDKLAQRTAFQRRFLKGNSGFLTGTTLYSVATVAKIATVCLGAAALGVPLVLPVALGIGGAILMGVCSPMFFVAHPRNKRYQSYDRIEHPEVNRPLLALLDGLADTATARATGLDGDAGLRLRAHLFEQADRRESALNRLLRNAAAVQDKHFSQAPRHADGTREIIGTGKRSIWRAGMACGAALGSFVRALATGRGVGTARQRAYRSWWQRTPGLSRGAMLDWLDSRASRPHQICLMRSALEQRRDFLAHQIDLRGRMLGAHNLSLLADHHADQQEWRRTRYLLKEINTIDETAGPDAYQHQYVASIRPARPDDWSRRFTAAQADFVALQLGKPSVPGMVPSAAEANRRFARYCLKDGRAHFTALRGVLHATELQAARLRQRSATATGDERQDAGAGHRNRSWHRRFGNTASINLNSYPN